MNYVSVGVFLYREFAVKMLGRIATGNAAAIVVSGKIRLSKDPAFAPAQGQTRAGLAAMEADYTGYAAGGIAAVFSATLNQRLGVVAVVAPALFLATAADPQVAATVTGWWIDDGTDLVCAERFAAGVTRPFVVPGDYLALDCPIPLMLAVAT